jgi:hypothetical protein
MTSHEFIELSAKLFKDLTAWIEEASKDGSLTTSDLAVLNSAMRLVERVTLKEAHVKPDTAN